MARIPINTSTPNTGLGATLRQAITDLNTMTAELYSTVVFQEAGKGLSSNDFTGPLQTKLSGIAAGAEVNVQADLLQADSTADSFIENKDALLPASPLSVMSGLAEGGLLTINTDASKFNRALGVAYIVDGHSDVDNPTVERVAIAELLAITTPFLATHEETYVAVDINGNNYLTAVPLTATERRNYTRLGVLIHKDNANITAIDFQPTVNIEAGAQIQDILEAIGFISKNGNRILPVGTNLKIKKEIGTVFKSGANFKNLTTQPHSFILPAQDPITFNYRTQTGVELATTTDIDPAIIDVNGTFTAMPTTATFASIQRVYIFQDGTIIIQPGQRSFVDLPTAFRLLNSGDFINDTDVENNGLYLGAIAITRNNTNLSNTAEVIFIPSIGTSINGSVSTPALGYTPEDVANKKNNLNVDGTGAKYPTVDAINSALSGTANTLPKYGATGIVDSNIQDTGTIIEINNPTSNTIGAAADNFNVKNSIKGGLRVENTQGEMLIVSTTPYVAGESHLYDANVLAIQNKSTIDGVLVDVPAAIRFIDNTDGERGAIGFQNGGAPSAFENSVFLAASLPYYPNSPLAAPTRLALIQEGDYLGSLTKIDRLEFKSDWTTRFKRPDGTSTLTIPVTGRVLINTDTDNNTDTLQVDGSALFQDSVTVQDAAGRFIFKNVAGSTVGFLEHDGGTLVINSGTADIQLSNSTTVLSSGDSESPSFFRVVDLTASGNRNAIITPNGTLAAKITYDVFADNAAAIAGGLEIGEFYRTSTGALFVRF